MKHIAAYLLLVLGGNTSPSAADVTTALSKVGVTVDEARLATLIAEMEGKDLSEVLKDGEALLAKFGGGGGGPAAPAAGGAAAPAAKKEEEKPKEEEMDLSGGMDMFGGSSGAKGDY